MVVKDLYQSGINVLIDGFKALMDDVRSDEIPNYGAKSNTMFEHCQITFLVSDIRGVELITLKKLANKVKVLTKNSFTSPKKIRPTIFSNEYPGVNTTEEYKEFEEVASYIVQANNILVKDLPEDIKNIPAIYMYNFAGSVSFDAFVTFEGSNLVQLLGVFPGQGLKNRDGSWIDPEDQYFINKAVASFKKIYYDALEGIFGTVDMQTDVALEKMYFSKIRAKDMSTITEESVNFPNILYARAIHPMGELDLLNQTNNPEKIKETVSRRMDYADSVVHPNDDASCFGDRRSTFLLDNTTFIIYAQCTIQTLLILSAYTDIISYYTDMKNVLGVSDVPQSPFAIVEGGIRVDGRSHTMTEDERLKIFNKNTTVTELVNAIEREKTSVLEALRRYQNEKSFYDENRFKNTKLRPPKSMIQRKEYYNMVPLYAKTCCVIRFTARDALNLRNLGIQLTIDGLAITKAVERFYRATMNYLNSYDN